MKRQSELVDNFCQDVQVLSKKLTSSLKGFCTNKNYSELMTYAYFNKSVNDTNKSISKAVSSLIDHNPKLSSKLTKNEKKRVTDFDVFSQ